MNKKLEAPITLVAVIEARQHEGLRVIAFQERRSLADVVREAIDRLIAAKGAKKLKLPRVGVVETMVVRKERRTAARGNR